MKRRTDVWMAMRCRAARKRFSLLTDEAVGEEQAGVERHLRGCERCAREYRIFNLTRIALDRAAADEPVRPGEDFFLALRARLNRGPEWASAPRAANTADEPWASVVMVAARQLIPMMAMLLLLIIGASLLWSTAPGRGSDLAIRPSERVIFNDVYDLSRPTPDDVLETLVAVEETENGK